MQFRKRISIIISALLARLSALCGRLILILDRELTSAVHLYAGRGYDQCTQSIVYLLHEGINRHSDQEEIERTWKTLTYRQRQVALLLSQNLTYREIAEKLYISPNTTRNHARQVMFAYGVHTKSRISEKLSDLPQHYFSILHEIEPP